MKLKYNVPTSCIVCHFTLTGINMKMESVVFSRMGCANGKFRPLIAQVVSMIVMQKKKTSVAIFSRSNEISVGNFLLTVKV